MAADLEFRIGAELTEIKGALAQLRKDFAAVGNAAQQAGGSGKSLGNIESSLVGAARAVKALVAGFAAFQGAQALKAAAAAGVEFNAQLESAQGAIASLIFAQAKLKDAQGQPVEGAKALEVAYGLAADQVQKLRIAGLETAATTPQLIEAFQTAVGPGIGAGLGLDQIRTLTIQITQAAGALNVPFDQLSQEIRSILDGSIDVNSRVAKTLGISNEQVKNWQAQGKLVEELSKRLQPFEEAGKRAADSFKVVASNASEAVQTLGGEVFKGFFDELKKGLADATNGIFDTKNLAVADDLKNAVDLAQQLATALGSVLGDALRGIVQLARDFSAYIGENRVEIERLIESAGLLLSQFFGLVKSVASLVLGVQDAGVKTGALTLIVQSLALLVALVRDGFTAIGASIVGIGSALVKLLIAPFEGWIRLISAAVSLIDESAGKALEGIADDMANVSNRGKEFARDMFQPLLDGKGAVGQLNDEIAKLDVRMRELAKSNKADDEAELKRLKAKADALRSQGSIAGLRNPPKNPGADQNQVLKARLEREAEILKQNYDDGLISLADYYKRRGELQVQAIDAEIQAELVKQSRLQKNDENGQRDAETKIAILRMKREAADRDNSRASFLDEKQRQSQLAELQAQAFENAGRLEDAAAIRTGEKFRDLITRLKTEGDQQSLDLVDKLISTEKARAKFQELQALIEQQTSGLQSKLAEIGQAQTLGDIGNQEAEQRAKQARDEAIAQITVLNEKLQELARNTNDPAIKQGAADAAVALRQMGIDGATGLDAAIQKLRQSMADLEKSFTSSVVNAGVDALEGFFTNIASGSMTAGEALKDFVRSFAASMAQIAAKALATYAVLQLLEAIFPGAGRLVAASSGVTAGVNHRGGMVGQGTTRYVNPLLFAGAPRYHSGGMVGLKPDERPAILQTGEEVLSRGDPRNRANGGGAGNGYRIVNVLDPSLVSGYLESAQGERAVLNVISRNPALVRQTIGA